MNFLKKLIDLILYGNFWIALCAIAFYWQTVYLLGEAVVWSDLAGLIFFASFFLYAAHRIVGIRRLTRFLEVDRYHVIAYFSHHIKFYAIITGLLAFWFFWQVVLSVKLALIIPGIISMAYVLPFLGDQKRLRDLSYIKIFLIAIVWAWVTVWLPALEFDYQHYRLVCLMSIERALFVFAITLPFDIRDLEVDSYNNVPTIPFRIGVVRSKWLGYILLSISFSLTLLISFSGFYTTTVVGAMLVSVLTTGMMIGYSKPETHDYFYSGLLDGSMLFQFLLIYGAGHFF